MLKKGKNGKLVMMYMDYTNEIPLPDQTLGLYMVQSFVFDFEKKEEAFTEALVRESHATRCLGTMVMI